MKILDVIDTLLNGAAKAAGPAAPYIRIGQAVAKLAAELVAAGHPVAEIRRRLADGIQRGDVVSDEALEVARGAEDQVDDYLDGLEG